MRNERSMTGVIQTDNYALRCADSDATEATPITDTNYELHWYPLDDDGLFGFVVTLNGILKGRLCKRANSERGYDYVDVVREFHYTTGNSWVGWPERCKSKADHRIALLLMACRLVEDGIPRSLVFAQLSKIPVFRSMEVTMPEDILAMP